MKFEEMVSFGYTFKARWGDGDLWFTSSGRWPELDGAAKAAAEFLVHCASNNAICQVETLQIEEINLLEDGKFLVD